MGKLMLFTNIVSSKSSGPFIMLNICGWVYIYDVSLGKEVTTAYNSIGAPFSFPFEASWANPNYMDYYYWRQNLDLLSVTDIWSGGTGPSPGLPAPNTTQLEGQVGFDDHNTFCAPYYAAKHNEIYTASGTASYSDDGSEASYSATRYYRCDSYTVSDETKWTWIASAPCIGVMGRQSYLAHWYNVSYPALVSITYPAYRDMVAQNMLYSGTPQDSCAKASQGIDYSASLVGGVSLVGNPDYDATTNSNVPPLWTDYGVSYNESGTLYGPTGVSMDVSASYSVSRPPPAVGFTTGLTFSSTATQVVYGYSGGFTYDGLIFQIDIIGKRTCPMERVGIWNGSQYSYVYYRDDYGDWSSYDFNLYASARNVPDINVDPNSLSRSNALENLILKAIDDHFIAGYSISIETDVFNQSVV